MCCCIDGWMYNGIAIYLSHGMAISWDGRVIKHDASVSRPDGPGTSFVGTNSGHSNHLYGTFTDVKNTLPMLVAPELPMRLQLHRQWR